MERVLLPPPHGIDALILIPELPIKASLFCSALLVMRLTFAQRVASFNRKPSVFFLPKACARILFAELIERWLVRGSVYLSPSYARSLIRYKNSIIATAVTATPTDVACVAGSTHVALSPDLDADRQDN